MNGTVLLLEVAAACFTLWVLVAVVYILVVRAVRLRQRELCEPLLLTSTSTEEYRLDVALREAEAGYNACRACGFENFKRSAFCGLCGAKVACERSPTTEPSACSPSQSQRLQRAGNRKEWTRKLDIEGKLFWYRDTSTTDVVPESRRLFPGYAAQFISHIRTDEQLIKNSGTDLATEARLSSVSADLAREAHLAKLTLIDASRADPGQPVLFCYEERASEWRRELVGFASMVFPDKYAHFVEITASRFPDGTGDVSGLQRECSLMLNECPEGNSGASFDASPAMKGLFRCVNKEEPAFYLNSNSALDLGEHHLMGVYEAGRLIGRTLLKGNVMDFHLSLPLLKIMLGIPVSFSDLQHFDSEAYKSLLWLEQRQGVKTLGLKFSVTETGQTEDKVVDLIPNGCHVDVTDDNKHEYLERRFRYTLFESVASQLYAFLKGLYEVIPQELLMVFDPEELDYLLCGSDEIDVDDWEKNTVCSDELQGHQVLTWFWELMREMPNEYRRRLLHFVTGVSRVPVTGFSALTSYDGRMCPFTLNGVPLKGDGHVSSHMYFNRLDLPLHEARSQLKATLFAAVALTSTTSLGPTKQP